MKRVANVYGPNGPKDEFFIKQDKKLSLRKENAENCGGGGKSLNEIYGKIQDVLINKKLYLEAGLTLSSLSQILCTNTTYLSKAINTYFHCNLKTLLNRLRVEYAKELLRQERCNIMLIPPRCGFLSRSTFYAAFSKFEGMTPADFRERYCTVPARKTQAVIQPKPMAV